jgi:hypothetical protein
MTTSITTRVTKGTRLSFTEMDDNFTNLRSTADSAAPQATTYTKTEVDTALSVKQANALLKNTAITASQATKITYDANGLVLAGTTLGPSDIPNIDYSKIISGIPTTVAGYGLTDVYTKTEINNVISSTSSNKQTVRLTTVGALTVNVGTARLYPAATMTLNSVFAAVNTSSVGADITVDVKKNGVSILGGSLITITQGTYKSAVLTNTTQVTINDYLTVDIIQVGSTTSGSDLVVTLYYA